MSFLLSNNRQCQKGSDPLASGARPRRNRLPRFSVSAMENLKWQKGTGPCRLRIYSPSFRRELCEIVNAEALLDRRYFIHDLFKSVFPEQFVFLLLEIFTHPRRG